MGEETIPVDAAGSAPSTPAERPAPSDSAMGSCDRCGAPLPPGSEDPASGILLCPGGCPTDAEDIAALEECGLDATDDPDQPGPHIACRCNVEEGWCVGSADCEGMCGEGTEASEAQVRAELAEVVEVLDEAEVASVEIDGRHIPLPDRVRALAAEVARLHGRPAPSDECHGPWVPADGFEGPYGPLQCEEHGTACPAPEVRQSWADHGPAAVADLRAQLAEAKAQALRARADLDASAIGRLLVGLGDAMVEGEAIMGDEAMGALLRVVGRQLQEVIRV